MFEDFENYYYQLKNCYQLDNSIKIHLVVFFFSIFDFSIIVFQVWAFTNCFFYFVLLLFHVFFLYTNSNIEGVVVAKKDFNQPKHDEIDTRNLYVIKALQSLTSKGYVKTQFSWQYYYYTLTDEGVEFLRTELNIPEGILPLTRLKNAPAERPRAGPRTGGPRRPTDGYRRRTRD